MISVIIAAKNEAESIRETIAYVYANAHYKRFLKEVILVDGGSTDRTIEEASTTGATILSAPAHQRAQMLNIGARQSSGSILYFMPARALPPENFISEIIKAHTKGYAAGTFMLSFDRAHWLLRTLCWLTNHHSRLYLSDQSLFITRELFEKAGGFREDYLVMANHEMIRRVKRYTDFVVLRECVLVSAQKYLSHGVYRTPLTQAIILLMHRMGYSQDRMAGMYRRLLHWDVPNTTNAA